MCVALLYGRAGRLTAENGGFRPGQYHACGAVVVLDAMRESTVAKVAAQQAIDFAEDVADGDANSGGPGGPPGPLCLTIA